MFFPGTLAFLSGVFIFSLLIFTTLRIAFFLNFRPACNNGYSSSLLRALYVGMKFDGRLAAIIVLPLLVLSWVPGLHLAKGGLAEGVVQAYFVILMTFILLIYFIDFGSFSYLRSRFNGNLLALKDTGGIWWQMIWQSYPVIRLSLILAVSALLCNYTIKGLLTISIVSPPGIWTSLAENFIFFLTLSGIIYGKVSRYPLRWSDAFFTKEGFLCHLALNPVLFLLESLKENPLDTSRDRLKELYPYITDYLGVDHPDKETLSLRREGKFNPRVKGRPNVVIILMETFAAYKTGVLGKTHLNSSPRFDALSQGGKLFSRFYVPMENTSRSLFAALFGIPDVSTTRSSSRNPLVVSQHTIINAFMDYEKYYFLGGSANWGNIRGMLSHNIDDLVIYDEGAYRSPVHDVWGISDADLFMEANGILREKTKHPFFAIIQTAGNHRPFLIPADSKGFVKEDFGTDALRQNGFYSLEEYNGFRFLDHSLGYYFDLAKKEEYFENTVFVILGDHGTGNGSPDRRFGGLSPGPFHVPFLLYAPSLLGGGERHDFVMSELDVMPTLAGLLGKPYINTTLGRDVFDPATASKRGAFTFTPFEYPPRFGFLDDGYYINVEPDLSYALYRFDDVEVKDLKGMEPERAEQMLKIAMGTHEFAKYLLYHNKRQER